MTSHDPHEDPTLPGARARPDDAGETLPTGRATGRPSSPKPPPRPDKTTPAGTVSQPAGDPGATNLLIGKVLGGCRIDGLLGRGAMGAVYKARQLKLDRDVAIKVIRPEMMADPRTLQRFEVEARTVGKFNSANVVMVHDIGFELGVHYLVMEFVQGKNLREHVKLLPHGRLPAGEALPLLRQACKGLDDARRLGVVHRDIKPDNLMLTELGVLKIADFGIAKPLQDDFHMTLTSELIGTPLYMSPEQCHGGAEIDFRSDMYSLGATFFYLLTGEPPIRASSVYELIQTKTKLENLCLWKALPELDENHPLSRVIERMTANDRDDRYESYEQLLNDLVLVEAGATITLPPKRPKRAASASRGERRKRTRVGAIAIAVLAVAAAGGGYAVYLANQPRDGSSEQAQGQPGVSPVPPGPNQPPERAPGIDAEQARQQLAKISGRLQQYGPDQTLADELAALQLPAELAPVRERLQRDLEAGQGVKDRLAAIAIPTELKLPFDDLQQHLAAVERASKVDVASGDELIAWRTRAVMAKRADGELGSLALARLSAAFNTWQGERRKAGNDKQRRADLAGELDRIEQGRRRLADLMPQQRAALDRDLPVTQLDAARRGLADDAAPPAGDVDVGDLLAQLQSEFDLDGPSAALRTRVDDLRPTRPDQAEQRSKLQNALEVASNARNNARETRTSSLPSPPQPPFDDVVNYYGALDRALSPIRRAGGVLPGWASALRTELRAEVSLGEAVRVACAEAFAAWQQRQKAGATATELQSGAERLRAARQRAAELFPGLEDRFASAVPEATLAEQLAAAQRVGARQDLIDAIDRLRRRLDVRSLDAWALAAVDIDAEVQRLATDAAPFAGDDAIARALQATSDTRDRWRAAAQAFGDAADRLAAGNLTACATVLAAAGDGVEGRTELQRLGELAGALRDAFDEFARTLDATNVRTALTAAARTAGSFTGLPKGVGDRIRGWQRGVDELAGKAAGMVPIASGATTPALYFAASECTRGEFRAFQAEVRTAAVGADDAQQFAAIAERVAGSGLTEGSLRALLNRQLVGDDGLPVERVTWNEAAAFAAWYGRALPTEAEWRLAAFGEPKQFEYPWGNDWPAKSEQFNGTDALVPAGDRGLSWRSLNSGPPLHHLAGNVAEWLAAAPDAREAQAAGGRYNLRGLTDIKERASGRRLDGRTKDDAIAGVGFRVVLRPRSVAALAWPR